MIWIAALAAVLLLVGAASRRGSGRPRRAVSTPPRRRPAWIPRQWQPVRMTSDPDLWMLGSAAGVIAETAYRHHHAVVHTGAGVADSPGTDEDDGRCADGFDPGGGDFGGGGASGDWQADDGTGGGDMSSDGGGGGSDGGGD